MDLITLAPLLAVGAIAHGGVLGETSGKVGNVVFSTWRGINTIRAHTTPANPRTDAQRGQRTIFGSLARLAGHVGADFWQTYWDGYKPRMSGFNAWMQQASKAVGQGAAFEALRWTPGTRAAPRQLTAEHTDGTDTIEYTWSSAHADADDLTLTVCVVLLDTLTKRVRWCDDAGTLASESHQSTLEESWHGPTTHAYAWCVDPDADDLKDRSSPTTHTMATIVTP